VTPRSDVALRWEDVMTGHVAGAWILRHTVPTPLVDLGSGFG
jgi:hypothetical protein